MLLATFLVLATIVASCQGEEKYWTNYTVPMDINPDLDLDSLRLLKRVVEYFEAATCLRFPFNKESTLQPRLPVIGKGCCSGNRYVLQIVMGNQSEAAARLSTAFHEMLHVFDFGHTHERPDRDLYINLTGFKNWVNTTNIYAIPYDFGSAVHYPFKQPWNSKYVDSVKSMYPSFYNILEVNKRHQCFELCANQSKPACQNGGVVDVNNCSRCFCPRQYSGDLCQERNPGNKASTSECGKTITVTDTVQSVEMPIAGRPKEEEFLTHCYYRLEAPACKRIQVTIRDVPNDGGWWCDLLGLEVFANVDKRQTGYRYCRRNRLNETIVSEYNTLMLETWSYSDKHAYTFKIDVVTVP